ncbi:MAG: CCA tRNA nucleotidyltransferase [Actinobacteria bacterium]|nr:MAG: CCA tRNA nucleotidyltransferase [Actinomycetota bacterium]
MSTAVRRYIRSLGLDAYVVGGAVRDELLGIPHRDEDFLVPGVDQDALRAVLSPHGRVEDMEVHGQLVGVRFHPRDPDIRSLTPHGIEVTPPRAERSTGPGHRDFEIVADPSIPLAEDMGRRDFTVNAMARRLETGELIDPFGGVRDLASRELRTVSATSFRDDPLRMLRGLRLVSQLGFALASETLAQMTAEAEGLRHVSGERIGGGLSADGMGELSKLLLGAEPARALRIARDTGVLVAFLPEFEAAIGYGLDTDRQPAPLDEHLFRVAQEAAGAGASLATRLAALLHDLGKPETDVAGDDHAAAGARLAGTILRRLRYPTRLRQRVVAIVRAHAFHTDGEVNGAPARRFLARHGDELAFDLIAHKLADLATKRVPEEELERARRLRDALETERDSPHRLRDLAVAGGDLIGLGFEEGPELGRVLHVLLEDVIDDPSRNERAFLLARAGAERS